MNKLLLFYEMYLFMSLAAKRVYGFVFSGREKMPGQAPGRRQGSAICNYTRHQHKTELSCQYLRQGAPRSEH